MPTLRGFLFTLLASLALPLDAATKPNIVIIFSDDQGYADLGVQGILDDVRTPHVDALARNGIRFTNGYITVPQCSPSRAGLLSGRYQQRFGFDDVRRGPLPTEEVTLAEALKAAGYATGMVCKWHVQPSPGDGHFISQHRDQLYKPARTHWHFPDHLMLPYMPEDQGFDEYFCGWDTENPDWPMRINYLPDGKGPNAAAMPWPCSRLWMTESAKSSTC